MSRVYNFSAGPATLPEAALQQAQAELLNFNGLGASVIEISHRSKPFIDLAAKCEADLRTLLKIPNNYKVLFLQGGALGQFSLVPMNILGSATSMDYLDTGVWSRKAIDCAKAYGSVNIVASNNTEALANTIPERSSWKINENSAYFHYCANETISGIEFKDLPQVGKLDLVSDMSSNILSRPIDVSKFGLIYAGAQKNIGPSGITIVIIREDLLDKAAPNTPKALNYSLQAAQDSMLNTPPTFAWYMVGLVAQWLLDQGGLDVMAKINAKKSALLYQTIDQSNLFYNNIDPQYRSDMNVSFFLKDDSLNAKFIETSAKEGLMALKGHKILGGMRASIYNAMPYDGVVKLCEFLKDFEKHYG